MSPLFYASVLLVATAAALPEFKRDDASRIYYGDRAAVGQFPYQAGLRVVKTSLGRNVTYICGGSLISNRYVLTSADCINRGIAVTVVLGSIDLAASDSEPTAVNIYTTDILYHEQYKTLMDFNIALIRLPQAVQFNDNIQAIKLASDDSVTFAGATGTVAGYGYQEDGMDLNLRYVSNAVLSNAQCKQASSWGSLLTPAHVCLSGAGGKSACNRDYGSPLVSNGVQIGIASYGGCGGTGIYTRVSSFREWIKKNAQV